MSETGIGDRVIKEQRLDNRIKEIVDVRDKKIRKSV